MRPKQGEKKTCRQKTVRREQAWRVQCVKLYFNLKVLSVRRPSRKYSRPFMKYCFSMTECCISLEITLCHRYNWQDSSGSIYRNHNTTSFQITPPTEKGSDRERQGQGMGVGECVATAPYHRWYRLQCCKNIFKSKLLRIPREIFTKEDFTSANLFICDKRVK